MSDEDRDQGVLLALSAQSEILNKMDSSLNTFNGYLEKMVAKQDKDEEDEEKRQLDEDKEKEEEELEKRLLEKMEKAGFTKVKKQDKEVAHPIGSKPEEQQNVIQASEDVEKMKKQDEDEEEDEEKEEKMKKMKKQNDKDEDEDEDKEYPEVEKLKKQNAELQKQLSSMNESLETTVHKAVEDRLRKAGWREEGGLKGPRRVELGADEGPLQKSAESEEDRIAMLSKLSYRQIVELQTQAEAGELPDGIQQMLKG